MVYHEAHRVKDRYPMNYLSDADVDAHVAKDEDNEA
jgi:hypothetical protein